MLKKERNERPGRSEDKILYPNMELKLIIPVLLRHHSSYCLPLGMNGRLALSWIGSLDNAFFPDVCMYNVSLNHQLYVIWKFLIYSSERIVLLTNFGRLDGKMIAGVYPKRMEFMYLFPLIISVYVRGACLLISYFPRREHYHLYFVFSNCISP